MADATNSTKRGFLFVADITGYTSYLSSSELEHAKDVLKTLLDILINHAKPPLALSGLEGDAVLSYAIDSDRFQSQAFIEMIEQTYVAFKRAIDLMVMNTSCSCNACANISALDLKFFVHHGEFAVQSFGHSEELVGSDVNLIHRIMKNSIVETTGIRAYTYYTAAAIDQLDLGGLTTQLTAHDELVPDMGEVHGWVADMTPVWEESKTVSHVDIDEDRVMTFVEEYPLPPEVVWGYLTNPESRAIFSNAKRQAVHERRNGRVGTGSVYECFHGGQSTTTNTILEWRPFSRIISENTGIGSIRFISIFDLEPIESGTRVTLKYAPLRGPLVLRAIMMVMFHLVAKRQIAGGMAELRRLMEGDIAAARVGIPEGAEISEDARSSAVDSAVSGLQGD